MPLSFTATMGTVISGLDCVLLFVLHVVNNRYEKKLKEMGAKHETEKEQAEVEYKSKLSSYEQRVDDLRERMEKQYAVDRRDLQQEAHKQASRELEKKVLEVQAEHDRKLQEAIQRAKLRCDMHVP